MLTSPQTVSPVRMFSYLCPSLPVEHRPSTTPRHRTLFWAALVIPDQLVPCCFSSASVSRLQLLRGRPLFLFPCGFQVRAWRVVLDAGFLRVCPIQPHFLCSICLATGSCPARSHRSSFRIFSCHWILFRMFSDTSKCRHTGTETADNVCYPTQLLYTLWEPVGQEPVAKQTLRRKWGWIGHTLRKPASSTTRQALT